jgi:hypothetical protein
MVPGSNPVDCKVAPSTPLAIFLQFEGIIFIWHSGLLAGSVICFFFPDPVNAEMFKLIREVIKWSQPPRRYVREIFAAGAVLI